MGLSNPRYPLQPLTFLPSRMIRHVRIRGGARLQNGAWDMMVSAAWYIRIQWLIIMVMGATLIIIYS